VSHSTSISIDWLTQPDYPSVLGCFTLLLSACPTQRLWTFDTSPELPHTLFSQIKDNKSFQQLVTKHYESSSASNPATPIDENGFSYQAKGKGKEASTESPLSWISDMLRSLVPAQTKEKNPRTANELPLPQALAKVMNFCFAEMQHESWVIEAKAAAAQCGFEVSH
jgi:senataxin